MKIDIVETSRKEWNPVWQNVVLLMIYIEVIPIENSWIDAALISVLLVIIILSTLEINIILTNGKE